MSKPSLSIFGVQTEARQEKSTKPEGRAGSHKEGDVVEHGRRKGMTKDRSEKKQSKKTAGKLNKKFRDPSLRKKRSSGNKSAKELLNTNLDVIHQVQGCVDNLSKLMVMQIEEDRAKERVGEEALGLMHERMSSQQQSLETTNEEVKKAEEDLVLLREELNMRKRDHLNSQDRAKQLSETIASVSIKYNEKEKELAQIKANASSLSRNISEMEHSFSNGSNELEVLQVEESSMRNAVAQMKTLLRNQSKNHTNGKDDEEVSDINVLTITHAATMKDIGARMRQTDHDSKHLCLQSKHYNMEPQSQLSKSTLEENTMCPRFSSDDELMRPNTSHTHGTQNTNPVLLMNTIGDLDAVAGLKNPLP